MFTTNTTTARLTSNALRLDYQFTPESIETGKDNTELTLTITANKIKTKGPAFLKEIIIALPIGQNAQEFTADASSLTCSIKDDDCKFELLDQPQLPETDKLVRNKYYLLSVAQHTWQLFYVNDLKNKDKMEMDVKQIEALSNVLQNKDKKKLLSTDHDEIKKILGKTKGGLRNPKARYFINQASTLLDITKLLHPTRVEPNTHLLIQDPLWQLFYVDSLRKTQTIDIGKIKGLQEILRDQTARELSDSDQKKIEKIITDYDRHLYGWVVNPGEGAGEFSIKAMSGLPRVMTTDGLEILLKGKANDKLGTCYISIKEITCTDEKRNSLIIKQEDFAVQKVNIPTYLKTPAVINFTVEDKIDDAKPVTFKWQAVDIDHCALFNARDDRFIQDKIIPNNEGAWKAEITPNFTTSYYVEGYDVNNKRVAKSETLAVRVHYKTHTVVGVLNAGGKKAILSPDGSRLYIQDAEKNTIMVIDTPNTLMIATANQNDIREPILSLLKKDSQLNKIISNGSRSYAIDDSKNDINITVTDDTRTKVVIDIKMDYFEYLKKIVNDVTEFQGKINKLKEETKVSDAEDLKLLFNKICESFLIIVKSWGHSMTGLRDSSYDHEIGKINLAIEEAIKALTIKKFEEFIIYGSSEKILEAVNTAKRTFIESLYLLLSQNSHWLCVISSNNIAIIACPEAIKTKDLNPIRLSSSSNSSFASPIDNNRDIKSDMKSNETAATAAASASTPTLTH